jgi:ADP-ribose pyrophosphatase YjhB (NUDIX family)
VAEVAEDGVDFDAFINGQDWRVAWCPPSEPPRGTPHGAEAVCVAAGRIVVVSPDGRRWGLPAGRPEPGERWVDTMRREVAEEACAEVTDCRLLGFSRGLCVRGPQEGLVLVRSMWRAEVRLAPWEPEFEMAHRRLLPVEAAFGALSFPEGLGPFNRRLFAEAGFPLPDADGL